jgi:hypothetical protein
MKSTDREGQNKVKFPEKTVLVLRIPDQGLSYSRTPDSEPLFVR